LSDIIFFTWLFRGMEHYTTLHCLKAHRLLRKEDKWSRTKKIKTGPRIDHTFTTTWPPMPIFYQSIQLPSPKQHLAKMVSCKSYKPSWLAGRL